MVKHQISLTDEQLRIVVLGLDQYIHAWQAYAKRRERGSYTYNTNTADGLQAFQRMQADVLAAQAIIENVTKLRDHLAKLIRPT